MIKFERREKNGKEEVIFLSSPIGELRLKKIEVGECDTDSDGFLFVPGVKGKIWIPSCYYGRSYAERVLSALNLIPSQEYRDEEDPKLNFVVTDRYDKERRTFSKRFSPVGRVEELREDYGDDVF